jgi:hypothetical protein
MRALLMVGYEFYKSKNRNTKLMTGRLASKMLTLKPILQRHLQPKGIDFKAYERYRLKSNLYFAFLWVVLFLILILASKIYLNAF